MGPLRRASPAGRDRPGRLGNALTASLLLGVLRAFWHLPLFFIPGSYQAGLGLGTGALRPFNLTAVAASVVMTSICGHDARSLLAALLCHASLNPTRATLPLPARTEALRTGLRVILAALIAWRCRPRTLRQCG